MALREPRALALAGFSSPAFALAALGLPISAILPPLYAELGLSLTVVGTVFMLTRFFDGFTDPVFGVLGDRIQTRWGRRRPAILVAIPFLMYGVYRVFMPSMPVTESDLLISMLILYVGWTMFTLAHTAWASELTASYDGRSRVMSFLQYFGLAGSVGVLMMPLLVDVFVDDATMATRAEVMGWLILVSLPVLTLVAFASISEQPVPPTPQPPWRETWKIFKRSEALRRLLLADLLTGIQGGVNGAVHFFFRYSRFIVTQECFFIFSRDFCDGDLLRAAVPQAQLSIQQASRTLYWCYPVGTDLYLLSYSACWFFLVGANSVYFDWC